MSSVIQSNPHHRKIELQSPLDLTHLQTQLSASARQKLDLHFPPTALNFKPATHIALGGAAPAPASKPTTAPQGDQQEEEDSDPLRAHVSRLVNAFLQRTWTAAAPSISINGLDAHTLPQFTSTTSSSATHPKAATTATTTPNLQTDPEPETEGIHYNHAPYDARLQTRLAELYGELEGLTAQVARLRREAPARGAETWVASLRAEVEGDEEAYQRARERAEGADVDMDEGEDGDGGKQGKSEAGWRKGWDAERHGEVRGAFEVAVGELARLRGMGAGAEDGVAAAGGGSGSGAGELGGLTATSGKSRRARLVAEELE